MEDEDELQDDEEEHEEDMMDGEEGILGNAAGRHHRTNDEQIDDDECGDAGMDVGEDVEESELEKYLRDIS
jgi:hypothetical protein